MINSGSPRRKILLVEDDPHVQRAFASLLEFDGHQVHAVDNGAAALAMLEQSKFDLVITDYLMPQLKGDELAVLIKQSWPEQPIILASGSLGNISSYYSSIPGVDCLLNKPFSLTELREAINWVVDLYADSRPDDAGIQAMLGRKPDEPDVSNRPRDDSNQP